jgi:hypothetical protein
MGWAAISTLVAGPATLAIHALVRQRKRAPLQRGGAEAALVVAAAVVGAAGATAAAALFPAASNYVLAGAAISAAMAPWAAGELLSGPSTGARGALRGGLIAAGLFAVPTVVAGPGEAWFWLSFSSAASLVCTLGLRGPQAATSVREG